MDKYYLFSKKVTHAVKVSMIMAISLLLFAYGQAAVGHESGYSPIGANAPNMLATNIDVGINQPTIPFTHLTISGTFVTAYNGTTDFTFADAGGLKGLTLEGVNPVEPDIKLTKLTGTITVGGKDVGNGKTFTLNILKCELSGTDLEYYDLSTTSIKVDIIPAELTLTNLTVDNKVYDGLLTAKLNYGTAGLSGFMFPTDKVILKKLQPSAAFVTNNAGDAKAITLTAKQFFIRSSDPLNRSNEYNYNLIIPAITANITQRPLLVSAACKEKVYNHNEIALPAMITLTDNRVTGEVFDITYTGASFATDDAGTAIPVTVEGIKITPAVDAANYTVNVTAPTFANITKKGLTISGISAENKVYDGNNIAMLAGTGTLVGLEGVEDVTLVSGSGTFDGDEVGEAKDVTFSDFKLAGNDMVNYTLAQPPTTHSDIELRPLLILATASDQVYDGDTDASVTLSDALSAKPRVSGDIFDIQFTPATFADANAQVDKPIEVTGINITGTDAKNYSFNTTANTKATITPVPLTITGVVGGNRDYDGTRIAPFDNSAATLVGHMEDADNVTLKLDAATPAMHKFTATGTFADKNVGVGKPVTITGFEIADLKFNKINYILTQPSDVTASVIPVELSVNAAGVNKEYDGKAVATVTLTPDTLDLVKGDVLKFTYNADFNDINVGAGKTVNVKNIVISSGNEAGNYALESSTENTTANIGQKELSVIAVAKNKVYDGDVDADAEVTLTPDPQDVAVGDILTLDYREAHFSDKNVAIGKTVTVKGITIKSGNTPENYILEDSTETPKADITKLGLTVDASVLGKIYNSDTKVADSTVTLTSSNKVGTDDLSYAFSKATFSDENVGDRSVLVEGISISGTDALNYALQNQTKTALSKITPKDLTVTAVGVNKVYNGITKAVVTLTTTDMVVGDDIGYDYTANFKVKDVDETGKLIPIAVTNIILKDSDAGNYHLTNANASTSTEAKITPRELIITGVTAADKIYNRNKVVDNWNTDNALLKDTLNPELDLVNKDKVTLTTSDVIAAFKDEDAGLKTDEYAKEVQFAGFKIMGDPNEYNYSLVQPTTSAKIIPVNLRITGVTAADKIYDGNRVATLNIGSPNLKLVGLLTGDETVTLVSSAATGEFAVKDAVEYQKVTTSLFALAGEHAGNYEILQPVTNASITDQTLVLTATSKGKIYDGTENDVTVTFTGWAANDDMKVTSYKALYESDDVANGISINVTDIVLEGADLKNYEIPTGITAKTTGNITPRTLKIIGVTAVDRTYNTTDVAILKTDKAGFDPTDFIAKDDLQLITTLAVGKFDDEDVKTAIPVTT